MKAPVGQVKPAIRQLPPLDFAYGMKYPTQTSSVAEVTSFWKQSIPSLPKSFQKIDYLKLNKLCTKSGSLSSRQFTQFKKEHPEIVQTVGYKKLQKTTPSNDIIFGKPSKPPTPFDGVIGNLYGNLSDALNNETYSSNQKRKKVKTPKQTKSVFLYHILLQKKILGGVEQKSDFKLKRFSKIPNRISSS